MGRLRAESSRAADDADAQRKSVTGQPQGQPHPTYFRPRRPRASPTLPRPSGDLSAAPATAPGPMKLIGPRGVRFEIDCLPSVVIANNSVGRAAAGPQPVRTRWNGEMKEGRDGERRGHEESNRGNN